MLGLAVIFVYAFFKFAWSYRLFNYVAIMVGARRRPPKGHPAARHSRIAPRGFAPTPAAISIAASAHSSSRSVISAGFSARRPWR